MKKELPTPYRGKIVKVLIALATLALVAGAHFLYLFSKPDFSGACPPPTKYKLDDKMTNYFLHDADFRKNSTERVARSVRIDTVVDDDQEDFSMMKKFHEYLESEFPAVFSAANVTIVNGYGYVIDVVGSDPSLKPIMLMAHQDTVPVGDISQWERSPWSGYNDGEWIYGRGVSDCKTLLIGYLEALDYLIVEGFKNKRSIIIASGFDEEIGGYHGAQEISKYMQKAYGPNSIEIILDEGIGTYLDLYGSQMIVIPVVEKGDVDLTVQTTGIGGHSSMPPKHTAIGTMSRFLSLYEAKEFPVYVDTESPMVECMECLAKHSPEIDWKTKLLISQARRSSKAGSIAAKIFDNTIFKWTVRTSTAIDTIIGGEKINALPMEVNVGINHRVAWGQNSSTLLHKVEVCGNQTASEYDVGFIVNGKELVPVTPQGMINVTFGDIILEPSFVTPYYDHIWDVYTGYLRSLYEDYAYVDQLKGKSLGATPVSLFPNTDTKFMWNLTDHIYRVDPGPVPMGENFHAPNERSTIDGHLQIVAFHYNYFKGFCG